MFIPGTTMLEMPFPCPNPRTSSYGTKLRSCMAEAGCRWFMYGDCCFVLNASFHICRYSQLFALAFHTYTSQQNSPRRVVPILQLEDPSVILKEKRPELGCSTLEQLDISLYPKSWVDRPIQMLPCNCHLYQQLMLVQDLYGKAFWPREWSYLVTTESQCHLHVPNA